MIKKRIMFWGLTFKCSIMNLEKLSNLLLFWQLSLQRPINSIKSVCFQNAHSRQLIRFLLYFWASNSNQQLHSPKLKLIFKHFLEGYFLYLINSINNREILKKQLQPLGLTGWSGFQKLKSLAEPPVLVLVK